MRSAAPDEPLALAVDALEGELELVVKELGGFLGRLPTVAGATIDGDGSVLLVLDVRELAVRQLAGRHRRDDLPHRSRRTSGSGRARASAPAAAPRVLVVEDSVGVRELQRVILEGAGYDVITAVDGLDGAVPAARGRRSTWCSPTSRCRAWTASRSPARSARTRGWEDVPVVIMTSRGDEADQRAGLDAGASAYLLKSEFDQAELVDTVRRLVGR